MRTPEEIKKLKDQWLRDPCWDIEDADGFEDHREELAAWRAGRDQEIADKRKAHVLEVRLRRFVLGVDWRQSAMAAIAAGHTTRRAIEIADEFVLLVEQRWVP